MKNFILLFAAFLFTGCFGLFESSPEVAQTEDGNTKGYKEVMRIKADCSSCASGGQDIYTFNGPTSGPVKGPPAGSW